MSTIIFLLIVSILNTASLEVEAQEIRIHNGTPAKYGDFNSMVFVKGEIYSCSGSILKPSWVLTAAHCTHIDNNNQIKYFMVTAGILNKHAWTAEEKEQAQKYKQERTVKRLLWHPKFELFPNEVAPNGLSSLNDIGLIEVSEPFVICQYIHGPAIWGRPLTYGPQNHCNMIGFGMDERGRSGLLQYAQVSSIDDCSTIEHHNISELYSGNNYACVYGDKRKRVDVIDSGGPLICNGVQYAVVFDVMPLSEDYGYENVYVTTYGYLDWIKQYVPDVDVCYNEKCI